MMAVPIEILQERFCCSICLKPYEDPRSLPCLHSFCLKCLKEWHKTKGGNNHISCPVDRKPVEVPSSGVDGFPVAFAIVELMETVKRETRSTQRPVEITKICVDHAKPFDAFCEDECCKKLVCYDCRIDTHRFHVHSAINDGCTNHRGLLQAGLYPVFTMIGNVANFLDAINRREEAIKEQGELAKEEVRAMVDDIIDILRQSESQLINEIERVTSTKIQLLRNQKTEAEMTLDNLTKCKEFVQEKLEKTDHIEFLESVKESYGCINNQTCQIINTEVTQRADIMLIKNANVLKSLNHIAFITTQTEQCRVKSVSNREIAISENKVSFPLSIEQQDSSVFIVPLSSLQCRIIPTDNTPVNAIITDGIQPGQFQVHCSPVIRGNHQVNVYVNEVPVQCIKLTIPVNPYLHYISPLRTIGNINKPWGIAISQDGNLIVSEHGSNCISIIDSNGRKVSLANALKFSSPRGVGVTPDNFIIFAEDHMIKKISQKGHVQTSVGQVQGIRGYLHPHGVAVSSKGFIYVADYGNHRIKLLTFDLNVVAWMGKEDRFQFKNPFDITVDSKGFIYVADTGNHRILKFHGEDFVLEFGRYGSGPGQLNCPQGLTVDMYDTLYVSEGGNHRISIFSPDGEFLRYFGSKGNNIDQFNNPHGLIFDREGHLYICDYKNKRIVVY